jgi:ribosomal protein S19E (S16A)
MLGHSIPNIDVYLYKEILLKTVRARYGGTHIHSQDQGSKGKKNHKFKPSLGRIARPYLKKTKQNGQTNKQKVIYQN